MRKPSTFLVGLITVGLFPGGAAIGLAKTASATTNGNRTVKMSPANGAMKTKSVSSGMAATPRQLKTGKIGVGKDTELKAALSNG